MWQGNAGMVTWWWVRHGPTGRTDMNGWTDVPADLSDTAALDRLADHLPADATIVSSDLVRAVTTADALARGRSRLPHQRGLREIHFGAWEARAFADIQAADPALLHRYLDTPGDIAPPGGESWNALIDRVNAVVNALTGAAGNIVAVAHFGPILTQIQRATRCAAKDVFGHTVAPLSVTRITFDGDWRAEEIDHRP